ncbi:hypothetical protein BN381_110043 [Candidatus Microthrix parvicella RN1]|uniref:Uncharacterized protein n=1 Tax=Candidatus Neomicrothrix parvicella RN1 TaxID=1229780 RepID=R4Z1A9_9ACTN|nr:hypothetical protein BN381_110043 [Candidatus Microthrix parvicella RN1]
MDLVKCDAVVEVDRQQRGEHRVEEKHRLPRVILGHAQRAVPDVAVAAHDVGPSVVLVVVGVLPVGGHRRVIPLPNSGVDFVVTHPVVLAMHDVVADFHVVDDLGQTQRYGARNPQRRKEPAEQGQAAADLQLALGGDDSADVVGILSAEVGPDQFAKLVHGGAEGLGLLQGEPTGAGGGLGVERFGVTWRRGAVQAGLVEVDLVEPGGRAGSEGCGHAGSPVVRMAGVRGMLNWCFGYGAVRLQGDVDIAGRDRHADLYLGAGLGNEFSGANIADATRLEGRDAGVANTHAAT